MNRYLIIVPRYTNSIGYGFYYELPLGLCYISSALKQAGFETAFVNLNHIRGDVKSILKKRVRNNDVILTGGLSPFYKEVKEILESLPSDKNVTTVLGGGMVTSEPDLVPKSLGVDVHICGEGEGPIVKFARGEKPTPEIVDINKIPFPDFEGAGIKHWLDRQLCSDEHYMYPFDKPRVMPILSSRGCPYGCTFCFSPLGKRYRQRSLDNFFEEVELLKEKYDINILTILDETVGIDKPRLEALCKGLKKAKLKWMTQIRVDAVDADILKMMKSSGCFQLSYGVESASAKVLKSMKKGTTKAQIEKALSLTMKAGIGIQGGLIFGDKAETKDTWLESLNWSEQHKEYTLNLMYVTPFPGSALYKHVFKKGYVLEDKKLSWIEHGCPNFVRMNDIPAVEIQLLCERLSYHHTQANLVVGKVKDIKRTSKDRWRGDVCTLTFKCPHCQKINVYKNMANMQHMLLRDSRYATVGHKIGCRHCNGRSNSLQWDGDNNGK